jgi:hypothetical protein
VLDCGRRYSLGVEFGQGAGDIDGIAADEIAAGASSEAWLGKAFAMRSASKLAPPPAADCTKMRCHSPGRSSRLLPNLDSF